MRDDAANGSTGGTDRVPPSENYDYVLVGAGSAGCVLANRLTADGETEVLLLEAGRPDEKREISVPLGFVELLESEVDWAFYTEPQAELADRELYWPRGKVLGGSSCINAMIYVRGHPHDYDGWADRGNEGWGYADLLPYFERGETFEPGPADGHGTDGPLHVSEPVDPRPVSAAILDAAAEVGYGRNPDFNADGQAGFGFYHLTQSGGERHSAADAYLKPVLDRPNLTARTGAHVTRIRFDGERATGVAYDHDGSHERAAATAEVLVAAGAVGSPQLLMCSGVGDADHLREHGIDVVADRPGVGRNLQDHLLTGVVYDCTDDATIDGADSLWNLANYLLRKRGPLTSNVAEVGGFVRTDPSLSAPDLQFHCAPGYFMRHGFDNPASGHGFSVGATQLRPESRGRVSLRSPDPRDAPVIDPRYLSAAADREAMVEGTRRAREIARGDALAPYRGAELWPGEDATSDDDLLAHVRRRAQTLYHPVGTCRMGHGDDAVVDDHLRVHGVEGLRVVDASVMPTLTGGNTNAPTLAIAEKAADLIRGG